MAEPSRLRVFCGASGVILPLRCEGMFAASVGVAFVNYFHHGLCALAALSSPRATVRKPRVCETGKKLRAGQARYGLGRKDVWAPGGKQPTQAEGWKEEGAGPRVGQGSAEEGGPLEG